MTFINKLSDLREQFANIVDNYNENICKKIVLHVENLNRCVNQGMHIESSLLYSNKLVKISSFLGLWIKWYP